MARSIVQLAPSRLSKPGGFTGAASPSLSALSAAQRAARLRSSARPRSSMEGKNSARSPARLRFISMMIERLIVVSGNLRPFIAIAFGAKVEKR
jgi:hypothetical protein